MACEEILDVTSFLRQPLLCVFSSSCRCTAQKSGAAFGPRTVVSQLGSAALSFLLLATDLFGIYIVSRQLKRLSHARWLQSKSIELLRGRSQHESRITSKRVCLLVGRFEIDTYELVLVLVACECDLLHELVDVLASHRGDF